MDANELPTDVEELKALLISTLAIKENEFDQIRQQAVVAKQEASIANQIVSELTATVVEQ